MHGKLKSVEAAVALIKDNSTVAFTGSGGGLLESDYVMAAIATRYRETGHPRNLTLIHALGIGNGKGSGLGRLAIPGLVKRIIGGHWSWSSELQKMARDNQIEAYCLPTGIIMTLYRESGAGRPGVISSVGLGTFVDPLISGGKCNDITCEDIVSRIELDGKTWLHYKPFKVDVAVIHGSQADVVANISTSEEPADLDTYAVALAAHNNGGMVIAQVKSTADEHFVPARKVTVPGVMIDHIVKCPTQWQSYLAEYDPAISGQVAPPDEHPLDAPAEGIRRLISGLAVRELKPNMRVNYGFGIPGGISAMADKSLVDSCWQMVEQGIHNGQLLDGALFGAAKYPQAIVSSLDQFDLFSGGGLDITFLGMGEMDAEGNVNVSQLGDTIVGPGGFIDITCGAKKVVFCGTFEAKGLQVCQQGERLQIESHGQIPKLVQKVRHITFSGPEAIKRGQEVLYVTERAIFRLTEEGVELAAIVSGVNLEQDILQRMQFCPKVDRPALVSL